MCVADFLFTCPRLLELACLGLAGAVGPSRLLRGGLGLLLELSEHRLLPDVHVAAQPRHGVDSAVSWDRRTTPDPWDPKSLDNKPRGFPAGSVKHGMGSWHNCPACDVPFHCTK